MSDECVRVLLLLSSSRRVSSSFVRTGEIEMGLFVFFDEINDMGTLVKGLKRRDLDRDELA